MSALLTATELVVSYNGRALLEHASFSVDERDRIGMVGRNGSGKSTLLRILAGQQTPEAGEVARRRDLVIGYLPQAFALEPAWTVEENIRAGAQVVRALIQEFESLPTESPKHAELEQRILALDGWGLDHRLATVMGHLHCPEGDRLAGTLSGGEQRRVALCRALILRPDLLLLDEPTNHLDTESIEWMGDFLAAYPRAFVAVTHDRYFLDRVASRLVEVANGTLYSHAGNYTDYLVAQAEREATTEATEHQRQMFLRRELVWVRRGAQARTTKAKGRLDRYYEVASQVAPVQESDVDLVIPPPPPLGNRIVELLKAGMEIDGRWLFSGLTLDFAAGQRLGITGRNGLGKTTLLQIILGQRQPTEGSVKIGALTRFNYVDQGRCQLQAERTVLEEISDGTEFVLFGEQRLSPRAYLKRFLFTDERLLTQIKYLSGGERSRLLLARILKNGGNVLILDEPTNDLDLPTLRVLEAGLLTFAGVVVVVSHDRYFLNFLCTDILAFEGEGRITHSVGNFDYYWEKKQRASLSWAPARAVPAGPDKLEGRLREAAGKPARPRRLSFKESRELAGMEAAIQAAEQNIARIEALFTEPDFHRQHGRRTAELTQELAAEKERVSALYERWQVLEAIQTGAADAT